MTPVRCTCGKPAPYWIVHEGRLIPVCQDCWKRANDPTNKPTPAVLA
jgi:hypothetical protein